MDIPRHGYGHGFTDWLTSASVQDMHPLGRMYDPLLTTPTMRSYGNRNKSQYKQIVVVLLSHHRAT